MATAARGNSSTHLIGLIMSLELPIEDLLQVTRERIEATHVVDRRTLTSFLENRAASKDARLATAAGEALSVEAVCTLRKVGRAAVHKAKDEGRLLSYKVPGMRTFVFPLFQFNGPEVLPWVPELINLVGNGFAAIHFLTVDRKSLNGKSYLTCFIKNEDRASRGKLVGSMLETARHLQP